MREKRGWVYIIRINEADRYTKIGITTDPHPKTRLNSIYAAIPYTFEVLGVLKTPTPRKYERILHGLYLEKRVKGEWFNLADEDITAILRRYAWDVDQTPYGLTSAELKKAMEILNTAAVGRSA